MEIEANELPPGEALGRGPSPAADGRTGDPTPTSDSLAVDAAPPVPARKWITAALMLVMVLASLEATVTSTAMPTFIGDLHGLEHYSWVASIYLLASTVVMPLYVQGGRGGDAASAAATITPIMLAWAISSMYAARMVVRFGFRTTSLIGAGLVLTGMVGLLICAVPGAPLAVMTAVLFLTGCGFGPAAMACLLAAQDAVAWQQRGSTTSGVTFFRCFGGAVGVGLLGTLFNLLTASELRRALAGKCAVGDLLNKDQLAHLNDTYPELLAAARSTISHGLLWVFAAMLIGAGAQVAIARLVRTHRLEQPLTPTEALATVGD